MGDIPTGGCHSLPATESPHHSTACTVDRTPAISTQYLFSLQCYQSELVRISQITVLLYGINCVMEPYIIGK